MNIQFGQSKELIVRPMQDLTGEQEYVPLDIDVSPFDNSGMKKEGVSRAYKGYYYEPLKCGNL
ncbi:hypothetical protein [Paenibacillus apiarius]|uniref:hypothetical protein n=1 Tax=Paenibacillus apiarius TaxID=46240 RepID=UPI00197E1EC9|nr:hypothetical protein [Paenibacillus apiarius]MBN3525819.1 hypothetical protein [Paenibacillus apiarius]